MKTRIYQALAAAALAAWLATPAAYAQLHPLKPMGGDIPFDFTVRDVIMPAGQYTVRVLESGSPALAVSSKDGRHFAYVLSTPTKPTKSLDAAKWVFRRYGNQHFLAAVWAAGDGGGREVAKCWTEIQYAQNLPEPTTVILVAKKH